MDTPAGLVDTPARIGNDVERVENSVDCTGEELVVASQSDLTESPDDNSCSLVSPRKTGRQCEKVQDQTVISPSRFHLLADDVPEDTSILVKKHDEGQYDKVNETEEVEEGEITSKEEVVRTLVGKVGIIGVWMLWETMVKLYRDFKGFGDDWKQKKCKTLYDQSTGFQSTCG
ncbi:hypothetical protein DY000_02021303 [Brassica cretica]|uniref:Uncharacterized protein n=1 Tax=Brassica cretica TaxID=69181 RepID=A0ABQ7EIE3_BRACR|nr:hypothetical protein DY000_02021303 [Brassica cretica]